MSSIHPSACVNSAAMLGSGVHVGPLCVIESDVVLGDDCHLESMVVVRSGTSVGSGNYFAEGVILGGLPQHKKMPANPGRLVIGSRNVLREHVTLHRALSEPHETRIGDGNLLMVNAHVAHDCHVGDETILANNVMLAGHVLVEDRAYLSGAVGVHQFCRVGQHAMVGGQAHITKDVPPFVTVDGATSLIVGLNTVGLRRAGLSRAELDELKEAYRVVFRRGMRWTEAIEELKASFPAGRPAALWQFLEQTKRGCVQERRTPRAATLRLRVADSLNDAEPDDTDLERRAS